MTQDTFLSFMGSARLTADSASALDADVYLAGMTFLAAALRCSPLGGAIVDFAAGLAASSRKCLTGDLDRDSLDSIPCRCLLVAGILGLVPSWVAGRASPSRSRPRALSYSGVVALVGLVPTDSSLPIRLAAAGGLS